MVIDISNISVTEEKSGFYDDEHLSRALDRQDSFTFKDTGRNLVRSRDYDGAESTIREKPKDTNRSVGKISQTS